MPFQERRERHRGTAAFHMQGLFSYCSQEYSRHHRTTGSCVSPSISACKVEKRWLSGSKLPDIYARLARLQKAIDCGRKAWISDFDEQFCTGIGSRTRCHGRLREIEDLGVWKAT